MGNGCQKGTNGNRYTGRVRSTHARRTQGFKGHN